MMPDRPKTPPIDLQHLAGQVTAATGEPVSEADLERIMASLQSVSSFWETVALSGRTVEQVAAALRALAGEDAVTFEAQKVALTPTGLALAWQHSLVPRKLYRCPHCEGRGLALAIFQRTQVRYQSMLDEWRAGAAVPDGAATPAAVMALAAFLADRGDLMGKDIIVVGDDALTGVALALSGFPRRVLTLEREPVRTAFLREAVQHHRLKLDIAESVGGGVPTGLEGQFATAVLPDLASPAMEAAAALRGPGAALVGLWSHADHPLTALARLEEQAQARGLVLTDLLRDFGASDPAFQTFHPRQDDADPFRQPPSGVWRRPALVRFEMLP